MKATLKNTGFDSHPFGCHFLQVACPSRKQVTSPQESPEQITMLMRGVSGPTGRSLGDAITLSCLFPTRRCRCSHAPPRANSRSQGKRPEAPSQHLFSSFLPQRECYQREGGQRT